MNTSASLSHSSSLSALRGAVGEIVSGGDPDSAWDRLVWMWRIFMALDGLIALLRSIVGQIASGEIRLDPVRPGAAVAVAVQSVPAGVVGFGAVGPRAAALRVSRRRIARLRTAVMVPVRVLGSRVRTCVAVAGVRAGWVGSPVLATSGWDLVGGRAGLDARRRWFSKGGWGLPENCV